MQIIREAKNYIYNEKPLLLALGNFDGVHYGHKKLLSTVVERARMINGTAAAFIFDPHPASVLTPDKAPRMLVTTERKAELLEQLGLDLLVYHSFTLEIARWSAEEFVQRILLDCFKVSEVYVGFNYSFGHQGAGTPELLRTLSDKYGFETQVIPPVTVAGEVVSSSLIRNYLKHGAIDKAYYMLGYYPLGRRVAEG
ncbi:MAG: Riboflavin biosynthesis protein RibF [Pelotomaculum sp. PtaB.Bin104]|nr:MAG: Riboflavin biosynthesis protein RibF [Pelotomaculum sp. PtaB.Bin104]